MKDFSAQDTLLTALPIVFVLIALVGAIIFFPKGGILDIRGRATPARPAPTIIAVPTPIRSETVCSELYKPVCSTVDGKTYSNECEANLAEALPVKPGACPTR